MDCSEEVGGEGVNNYTRDTYDSSVRSVSERQRVREDKTCKPSKMVPVKRRRVFLFFGSFLYFLPATKRKEMNITNTLFLSYYYVPIFTPNIHYVNID